MADIFISYASDDREWVRKLAAALEANGWSVWWDRNIGVGETFDQVIEHELETAKSVVVVWSKNSIASEWVKSEASAAVVLGLLVPIQIDQSKIPLEFRRKQTADLGNWHGSQKHRGFQKLCDGISSRTATVRKKVAKRDFVTPLVNNLLKHSRLAMIVSAIAAVALALLVAIPSTTSTTVDKGADVGTTIQQASAPAKSVPDESKEEVTKEEVKPALGAQPVINAVKQEIPEISSPIIKTLEVEGNSIVNPAQLALGTTYKITLAPNGVFHLKSPTALNHFRTLLDMQFTKIDNGYLEANLAVLDEDGVSLEDSLIQLSVIDVSHRKTAIWSSNEPLATGFKLTNGGFQSDFWFTVEDESSSGLVPFQGKINPKHIYVDKSESGILEKEAYVYYITTLPKGRYKYILDFTAQENTYIEGGLFVLDSDGGNQQQLIDLGEINVASRKVGTHDLDKNTTQIIKILNVSHDVNYRLEIVRQ